MAGAGTGSPATRRAAGAETAQTRPGGWPPRSARSGSGRRGGSSRSESRRTPPRTATEGEVAGALKDPVDEIAGDEQAELEHRHGGRHSKHRRSVDTKQPR